MKNRLSKYILIGTLLLVAACGGENTESNVEAPGEEKTTESRVLGIGADIIQDKSPLDKMNVYLDGFHFYNGFMGRGRWKPIIM